MSENDKVGETKIVNLRKMTKSDRITETKASESYNLTEMTENDGIRGTKFPKKPPTLTEEITENNIIRGTRIISKPATLTEEMARKQQN